MSSNSGQATATRSHGGAKTWSARSTLSAVSSTSGSGSEDEFFSRHAKECGFELWVDTGTPVGHMRTAVLCPVRLEGQWRAAAEIGDELLELPTRHVEFAEASEAGVR